MTSEQNSGHEPDGSASVSRGTNSYGRLGMLRSSYLALSAALLLLITFACGAGPEADQEEMITVGFGTFPTPGIGSHAPSLIEQLELDRKHGWEQDVAFRPTADALYGDLRTGVYSTTISSVLVPAILYNEGVPIKIVGAMMQYPWPFVVRADAGIENMEDLRGKEIGLPRASLVYGQTITAVKELAGVDLEADATLKPAEVFETPVQLSRGDVHGAPVLLHQAIELLSGSPGEFKVLFDVASSFATATEIDAPYWYLVMREELIEENPEVVDRVLAAYSDLATFVANQPDEVIRLLANPTDEGGAELPESIGEAHYGEGWEGLRVRYVSIHIDELYEAIQAELQAYVETGLLGQLPDAGFFYGR